MFVDNMLNLQGIVKAQLHDCHGVLKWEDEVLNTIVNQGKDNWLNAYFDAATQITLWYIGLVDNAGFTSIVAADTHAVHGGWVENTDYDEATRVEWAPGVAASQSITNAVTRDFSINATVAINGVFIAQESAKSSSSATILWAATSFASVVNAVNTDVLSITYTVNT